MERGRKQLKTLKVTGVGGVPTILSDLLESKYVEMGEQVETLSFGGAPVPPALMRRARQAFPKATLMQAYGLTETNAHILGVSGPDFERKLESTGIALPVCDAMIVKDGMKVPHGTLGEIWLRGPNIMKEYWRDPEATAKAMTQDGWLKTGDLAVMDEEGFIFIKDRMKDIIIRGGENVDSVSVENALYTEPGVLDAAAVGVPDDRLGEQVAAVVTLKPGYAGQITEASLLKTVSQLLPRFAVPVMIVIQEHPFEHTASEKILKGPLKAVALEAWKRRGNPDRSSKL